MFPLNPSNFEFRKKTPYNYDYNVITVSGPTVVLQINSQYYCAIDFEVRIKNDCGWGAWKTYEYFMEVVGGYYYSVYNNPSTSELSIEIIEVEEVTESQTNFGNPQSKIAPSENAVLKDEYNVYIVDFYGNIKYQKNQRKDRVLKLDTSYWAKGIYYIKMTNSKGKTISKGFAIE